MIYNELIGPTAASADPGTMRNIRDLLGRKNCSDVDKNYENCENFFLTVGRAYLTIALRDFFGMETSEGKPTKRAPSANDKDCKENIQSYMSRTLGEFVDLYILTDAVREKEAEQDATVEQDMVVENIRSDHFYTPSYEQPSPSDVLLNSSGAPQTSRGTQKSIGAQTSGATQSTNERPDRKRNYATSILDYYVMMLEMKDTAKEGDGDRLLINMKRLLLYFKAAGSSKKNYSIEMFVAIMQVEALLSRTQADKVLFGRFVNMRGGHRKNIENDLGHEVLNGFAKNLILAMGANKTEKAVKRATKASGGVKDIIDQFNSTTEIHRPSSKHTHRDSDKDLREIVKLLGSKDARTFSRIPGRKHNAFPNINCSYIYGLDDDSFVEWLKGKLGEIDIGYHF